MRRDGWYILMCVLVLLVNLTRAYAQTTADQLSKDDQEIIELLEFFQNYEVLQEDAAFIQDIEDVEKEDNVILLGEDDDK